MRSLLWIALVCGIVAASASAEESEDRCAKVGLTDDQKAKIKEDRFNFKEAKIDLKAQLEKSKLKYDRIMANPKSDFKAAKAASQEVTENMSKLIAAKKAFKLQIAFQVLKPEQRGPAQMCEHQRKGHFAQRRHRHHHDNERWS